MSIGILRVTADGYETVEARNADGDAVNVMFHSGKPPALPRVGWRYDPKRYDPKASIRELLRRYSEKVRL